jgi:hypothetical protein
LKENKSKTQTTTTIKNNKIKDTVLPMFIDSKAPEYSSSFSTDFMKLLKENKSKTQTTNTIKNKKINDTVDITLLCQENELDQNGFLMTQTIPSNPAYFGLAFGNDNNKKIGIYINLKSCLTQFHYDISVIKERSEDKYNDFKQLFMNYIETYSIIKLYRYHSHDSNGTKTAPDGFCGYRSLYQLHKRINKQVSNPNWSSKKLDGFCANADPNLQNDFERESFIAYLKSLQHNSKQSSPIFYRAVNKVINFIETERRWEYKMFPITSNAWMNGDWLTYCFKNNFTITGSSLLPTQSFQNHYFSGLADVANSSISDNYLGLYTHTEIINILSGVFVTYENHHYGVEPIHDKDNDISWFEIALSDVCNNMYNELFN